MFKGTWKKEEERFGGGYTALVYGDPSIGDEVVMVKKSGDSEKHVITDVKKKFVSKFTNGFVDEGGICAFCGVEAITEDKA